MSPNRLGLHQELLLSKGVVALWSDIGLLQFGESLIIVSVAHRISFLNPVNELLAHIHESFLLEDEVVYRLTDQEGDFAINHVDELLNLSCGFLG